ncbi:MAG: adenylosuccinate synthetase [Oligoflexia bacterium]|nr:adenylosuccinate synthetase [Oligoflexia bacterium]
MSVTAIIGAQWGDEGKGKIVDYYCNHFPQDMVIRSQGGPNAGHTIYLDNDISKKVTLRQIPSGIFAKKKLSIIGAGTVINPVTLVEEMNKLQGLGVDFNKNTLLISHRAHLIFPWHLQEDKKDNKIGTTGNGIGPCYASKAKRIGITIGEFFNNTNIIKDFDDINLASDNTASYVDALKILKDQYSQLIVDTHPIVTKYLKENKNITLEGAQGLMLDLDFGTYPYVTSSSTTTAGLLNGAGIPPKYLTKTIGVFKAYTTRVGAGPFPSEDLTSYGENLQTLGHEFGSVTGRKRRTGHLDLVQLKYASEICGFDELAIVKWDIIEKFDYMKIAYDYTSTNADQTPDQAIYQRFEDPKNNSSSILKYIEEKLSGPKITMLSYGPKRDDIKLL